MKIRSSRTRSLLGRFLLTTLILNSLLAFTASRSTVEAQNKNRIIVINADQPNVWTLEQAHYLLAQMHRRDLDLKTKSLEDLDPNTINGLRFDVLRTLIELGASYNQANAFTNKILERNKTFDAERRTQLISDRKKLRDESLQLTRDISDLETQKASAKSQGDKDQLDAQIAAKTTLRTKIDKEIELDDSEIKTLGDSSGEFKSTDAQVQFDKSKLPESVFDDAFKATAKSLMERFNASPTLNASMMLENVLQLQYEIVAKQLTLLRDEVGPGERLLFLELPQTVNVAHHEADKKWAQSWWKIKGYTWREEAPQKTDTTTKGSSSSADATPTPTPRLNRNEEPIKTIDDYKSIVKPRNRKAQKPTQSETTIANRGLVTKFANLDDATPVEEVQNALSEDNATFSNQFVRAVELVPRQGSLNVNDMRLRTQSGAFSFVASFLFGFGSRLNVQRQREQFSQFVQQELYSSAFGKGSREFGWTFTPMPGTDRLLSGDRTTYAAVIVPDTATQLLLESNGCYFPRSAYEPNNFADTVSERWNASNGTSRNCGAAKAFLVAIPTAGADGSNDFWVEGVSYQPVPKGQRIVVHISGSNFSSQLGVLINGVPLTPAIGMAQPLFRDDSKDGAAAAEDAKAESIHGTIERVDANQIVFSFVMPSEYKGTPTITLIAPGKAIDVNWLRLHVRDAPKKITLIDYEPTMFGSVPAPEPFRIDSVEVFRTRLGSLRALIHGAGFTPKSPPSVNKLYINGLDVPFKPISSELIEVPAFPAPSDDTVQVTLVYDDDTVSSESIANPVLPKISKVGIVSYEAGNDEKPGVLVVKIEGVGFPTTLQSDDPKRIKVTVTSSSEVYLTIKNPDETEVVTLKDPVTGVSLNAVVTRKQSPK